MTPEEEIAAKNKYTLSEFISKRREAFNKAEFGEEVLIIRHGAVFALISVELALKNQPLGVRLRPNESVGDRPTSR